MQFVVNALNWLNENSGLIAVVFGILAGAMEVYRATGNLRQGLLSIMLRAEKASAKGELGPVNGGAIMDLVVQLAMQRLVPKLPVYMQPFVTESMVRKLAHYVYEGAKRYLEDGHLLPPVDSDPLPEPPVEQ